MSHWLLVPLGVLAAILFFGGIALIILEQKGGEAETPPCPCDERLRDLARGAHQLAYNLAHFDNWWPAVHDDAFDGKLPDGFGPVTHADAKETILYMFGQFLSAAWTYQSFCKTHPHRGEVKEWVDRVYDALGVAGANPDDPADARVPSTRLHEIGKICTNGWGTANGRPVDEGSEFRGKLEYHPEAFKLLWGLLRTAEPGTAAHARVKAVEAAARNVEKKLAEKDYVP